jgi:hypothetical protein
MHHENGAAQTTDKNKTSGRKSNKLSEWENKKRKHIQRKKIKQKK